MSLETIDKLGQPRWICGSHGVDFIVVSGQLMCPECFKEGKVWPM